MGLLGCASTSAERPRRALADEVERRAAIADGIEVEQDVRARERARARVAALLARPLTVDTALRVALLNNRGLQATLEDLGVAQAELVEAGLLDNPMIAGDLVVSTRGNGLGGGVSLSTSLLSAFLIPAKRKLAKAHLQHAVLTTSDSALALIRDVRIAYADVQLAMAVQRLAREQVQLAQVADELAARQREAGNVTALVREQHAAVLDDRRLALLDADVALVAAREHLSRLLGVWGGDTRWTLAQELSPIPAEDPELAALEQRAIEERLDVSAARAERAAVEYALKLRRRALVPQIEGGVESRNEVGGHSGHEWVLGPSLAIELPIFDPGHADFAMLRSAVRRAEHLLQQRAIVARSEVREQRERLVAARRRVDYYRDTVLPRQQTITDRALEQYNGMLIGAYDLFAIRGQQTEQRAAFAAAVRDYWAARAELELAVGGRL
jgi:cobalt-zinc-cadmium efflux system outer membrane protein